MKKLISMAFCLAIASYSCSTYEKVYYTGYRLMSVGPMTEDDQVAVLLQLLKSQETSRKIVMMSDTSVETGRKVWIAVAPDIHDEVTLTLSSRQIVYDVIDDDIQKKMDENAQLNMEAMAKSQQASTFAVDHTAYLRYDNQVAWLLDKAAAAGSFATAFPIGTSYEGRSVYAVGINNENLNLPVVWIHGNANARDWLTSATALYLIDQILTGASADAIFLRTNFRFFITPNLNPDGYEYTWNYDRAWVKTLSSNPTQSNCTVPGVYAVGNFAANFGGAGCNSNPCSDTYCGAGAFSELETQSVRDFIASLTGQFALFVSLDSFGQQWLVPWGCYQTKPLDYDELNRVAYSAVNSISQVNGLNFTVGTPADLTGAATGTGFDWSKLTQSFSYAYSVRLRPATAGAGGFDIPPDNINPSGQEVFAGIATVCREMRLSP